MISFRIDGKDFPVKNCPFCGSVSLQLVTHKADDVHFFRDKYSVLCDYRLGGCGAESGIYPNKEEAIAMWNQRRRKWRP